jgi:FkbM family methyltransferase
MIYLLNLILIFTIKVCNKFGRGFFFKTKMLSSERILKSNFDVNTNFKFVQVGANDGVSFDFLYDFVIQRKSSGIVVEPVLDYFKELEYNYRGFVGITKINKAIHPTEKEISIYRINPIAVTKYPDWVKGISSLDFNHHKKTNINSNDIEKQIVKCETLMRIILDNLEDVATDYFQIDTEGFDYEVLKMVDFNSFKPSVIKFEFINLSPKDNENARIILKENGYYMFDEFGDTIGINLHYIKLL